MPRLQLSETKEMLKSGIAACAVIAALAGCSGEATEMNEPSTEHVMSMMSDSELNQDCSLMGKLNNDPECRWMVADVMHELCGKWAAEARSDAGRDNESMQDQLCIEYGFDYGLGVVR